MNTNHTLALGDTHVPRTRDRIINLYREGITDLAEIVRLTGTRPSYAAQVLARTINVAAMDARTAKERAV